MNKKNPPVRLRSRLIAAGVACTPLTIAFIIIIALNLMPIIPAISVWCSLSFVLSIMVFILINDLSRLHFIIEQFISSDELEPIGKPPRFITNLLSSLQNLKRMNIETINQLKYSYNGFEKALDALPGPVLLLGVDAVVIRANVAAKQLLSEDIEGRIFNTILRAPALTKAIETIDKTGSQNVSFTLPTPVPRIFSAHLETLANIADDGTAIVVAILDVTTSKQTHQMQADFVANASHEIRTPLATLSGFIETLRGPARNDPEAREKFLEIMSQHADRMAQLIDNLLSLSRIEMNEHTVPTGNVNLCTILSNVVNSLNWQAKERSIRIETFFEDKLQPLLGDESELIQLFHNLVDNAIKYSRENSTVTIRATAKISLQENNLQNLNGIIISVSDEGEGISREHLPRLTERFYRVDSARSRKLGGTGLGLAIVKHIANRHRAELNISSELGKGSCFSLMFPLSSVDHSEIHKSNRQT